jgi:hypothetical protein
MPKNSKMTAGLRGFRTLLHRDRAISKYPNPHNPVLSENQWREKRKEKGEKSVPWNGIVYVAHLPHTLKLNIQNPTQV